MNYQWSNVRRFLVAQYPRELLHGLTPLIVRQGYITSESANSVSIKDEGGKHSLYVKQGFGKQQQLQNISLTVEQFSTLWPSTQNQRVEMHCFAVRFAGRRFTFEVYQKHLAPLILVSVEFDSELCSKRFELPEFIECEVTHSREYQNEELALSGLPDTKRFIGQAL